MALRNYVDIDTTSLPERFEYEDGDVTYIFDIRYNRTADFFVIDLYDADENLLLQGEKLVLDQPLWTDFNDNRFPTITLVPMDEAGNEVRIDVDNFYATVRVYEDVNDPDEMSNPEPFSDDDADDTDEPDYDDSVEKQDSDDDESDVEEGDS